MKSFQPFSSETIVSSVSLLYIASQRPVRLRYTAEEKSRYNPLSFANIQGYPHEFSTKSLNLPLARFTNDKGRFQHWKRPLSLYEES